MTKRMRSPQASESEFAAWRDSLRNHAAVDDVVELDQWQLTPAGREALERMYARLHPDAVPDTSRALP